MQRRCRVSLTDCSFRTGEYQRPRSIEQGGIGLEATSRDLEQYSVELYDRVQRQWEAHKDQLPWGFSIRLMILGENAASGVADEVPHIDSIPSSNSYVDAHWKLARTLRDLFNRANLEQVLARSVISNFLFFKTPSVADWNRLDAELRRSLENLCREEIRELIRLCQPTMIMVLGLDAFDRHAEGGVEEVERDRGDRRRLLVKGKIHGTDAFGILHPTGAWVGSSDWDKVASWMSKNVPIAPSAGA